MRGHAQEAKPLPSPGFQDIFLYLSAISNQTQQQCVTKRDYSDGCTHMTQYMRMARCTSGFSFVVQLHLGRLDVEELLDSLDLGPE